jgi:hypothetical protein
MSDTQQVDWITRRPATRVEPRRGYITIPAFSYSDVDVALEASYIRVQFCFSTPNNFTINTIPTVSGGNYAACIRYRVGDTIYRYKLWDVSDTVIPHVSQYAGQVIKKNFVIEIWTVPGAATVSQASSLQMLLSIRAVPTDYRVLTTYEVAAYTVGASLENVGVTAPPSTGLEAWYRADNYVLEPLTNDVNSTQDLSGNSRHMVYSVAKPLSSSSESIFNAKPVFKFAATKNFITGALATNFIAKHIYLVMHLPSPIIGTSLLDISGVDPITFLAGSSVDEFVSSAYGAIGVPLTVSPMDANKVGIVHFKCTNTGVFIRTLETFDLTGELLGTSAPELHTQAFVPTSQILVGGENLWLAELLMYSDENLDTNALMGYLSQRYGNAMPLPMDFASTNAWLDNA